MRSYRTRASISPRLSEVTTKRGFGSPRAHSALPTTRRRRDQLSRVDQRKSRKRRAGRLAGPSGLFPGPGHLDGEFLDQAGIAGQAEDEVDAVRLAPGHQRLAGEAAVGAEQDANPGPARPDAADGARDLLDGPGRGIDVGPP